MSLHGKVSVVSLLSKGTPSSTKFSKYLEHCLVSPPTFLCSLLLLDTPPLPGQSLSMTCPETLVLPQQVLSNGKSPGAIPSVAAAFSCPCLGISFLLHTNLIGFSQRYCSLGLQRFAFLFSLLVYLQIIFKILVHHF